MHGVVKNMHEAAVGIRDAHDGTLRVDKSNFECPIALNPKPGHTGFCLN